MWKEIANIVPENSRVFDAGCGTGGLALLLRKEKNCQVVGADLSRRMLDFASKSNPYDDLKFLHMDISDITEYQENSFDYSVMCLVIHEIPADKRLKVISELMRIGRKTIIIDSNTPLPLNIFSVVYRMFEATFGRDHYGNFKSYISSGGIMGILKRAGLTSDVVQRLTIRRNCYQIVVLAR